MPVLPVPEFRPWRELGLFSVMVMDVCWVMPWFRTLTVATGQVSPLRAFFVLLAIMFFAHLLIRLLFYLQLKALYRQEIVLVLMLISIWLCFRLLLYQSDDLSWLEAINRPLKSFLDYRYLIPEELVVLGIVVVAWWRGIALAQDYMGPSTVLGQFVLGMVMFIFYVLLVMLGTSQPPPMLPFYLFLFVTLVGMTAARISVISTLRGGRRASFDWRWFIGVMSVASLLVFISYAIINYSAWLVSWFGQILMMVVAVMALVLWVIFAPLFYLLVLGLARLQVFEDVAQTLLQGFNQFLELGRVIAGWLGSLLEKAGWFEFLAWLGPGMRLLCLGGVVLTLLGGVLLWAALQLWREYSRRSVAEEQFSLDSAEMLQMLSEALRRRLESLREAWNNAINLQRHPSLLAAARIRRIYADLLELAQKLGAPRPMAQTPLEYLPRLEMLFPQLKSDVAAITQAYLRVRYGLLPENRQEIEVFEAAWQRLSQDGQGRLNEIAKKRPTLPGRSSK